ncbi:Sugar transporter [Musa troglodytarum]|uniref:Sugar transporter n=1 Tax=Musa troglodytarum TaxID=320322 RepID=A0A9E7JGW4_9LILI|nr:Sugar transporter [Musa troglodytarum]
MASGANSDTLLARDVTSSEIENPRQPLINGVTSSESYSATAAILPFLFPALGGLLYGYDIGATSGAKISLQSSSLSGTTWYNLSSLEIGLVAMHAAPMYIAETSPTQIRGRLISLKEFFIVFGMLLGYISGSIYVDLIGGWRYMYATSAPICLIMGIGMWWLPPSPRWLLLCTIQGKGSLPHVREVAITCLCRLRGVAFSSSASEQVDLILDELSYVDQEKQAAFSEIFQGKCLKALIIGAGLVTGQPSVLYYAATILQSAGFSAASDATRVSILLGLLKLIMTGVAVLVVDRLGRRPLLIGGVSGIAISLFLLSSYYTLLKALPAVAVIALLLYVGCYQIIVSLPKDNLTLVGTGVLFAGFGVIAIASLLFIFFIVPETKGLTLEEIEAKIL